MIHFIHSVQLRSVLSTRIRDSIFNELKRKVLMGERFVFKHLSIKTNNCDYLCTVWTVHNKTVETKLNDVNHIYKHDAMIKKKFYKILLGFLEQNTV